VTIFYCSRFETSLFVASYDSRGHGGCIRPRLRTGLCFSFGILLTYIATAWTHITENTCNVIVTQPVHWCVGWTYRKHISRGRYSANPLARWMDLQKIHHVTATYCCVSSLRTQRKHFKYCWPRVLRALPSNGFIYHNILKRVHCCYPGETPR
jgi:hypothetical protein